MADLPDRASGADGGGAPYARYFAVLLAAFFVYTCARVGIAIASGSTHGRYFWAGVAILAVLAGCALRGAVVLWRRPTRPAGRSDDGPVPSS